MTVILFPTSRIVRSETQRGQGTTPLALMLMPARFWLRYASLWMDLAMDAEDMIVAKVAESHVRRRS